MRQRNLLEKISETSLILSGLVAIVAVLLDIVFGTFANIDGIESKLLEAVIFLLGVLATSLGIERVITFSRIETEILRGARGVYLYTWPELYAAANVLVRGSRECIRATAFGEGKWQGPDEYLENIVEVTRYNASRNPSFRYWVIYAYHDSPDIERAKHIINRYKRFADAGLSDFFKHKYVTEETGTDLLIIDEKHLIIAFQDDKNAIKVGIKFEGQPEFVRAITQWYDQRLWYSSSSTEVDLEQLRQIVTNEEKTK